MAILHIEGKDGTVFIVTYPIDMSLPVQNPENGDYLEWPNFLDFLAKQGKSFKRFVPPKEVFESGVILYPDGSPMHHPV